VLAGLETETLAQPRAFDCEAGLHARLSFEYDGKGIVQHQLYGAKGKDVCIAVWARPPDVDDLDQEVEAFRGLLKEVYFS
jgi:hypothetical protein